MQHNRQQHTENTHNQGALNDTAQAPTGPRQGTTPTPSHTDTPHSPGHTNTPSTAQLAHHGREKEKNKRKRKKNQTDKKENQGRQKKKEGEGGGGKEKKKEGGRQDATPKAPWAGKHGMQDTTGAHNRGKKKDSNNHKQGKPSPEGPDRQRAHRNRWLVNRLPWQEPPRLQLLGSLSPAAPREPTPLLRLLGSHSPTAPEEPTPLGPENFWGGIG